MSTEYNEYIVIHYYLKISVIMSSIIFLLILYIIRNFFDSFDLIRFYFEKIRIVLIQLKWDHFRHIYNLIYIAFFVANNNRKVIFKRKKFPNCLTLF